MRQTLTISALAKRAGVTAKSLRYWERIGLLPRANRTHNGYRIFAPDVTRYIDFILKAKTVGLTLSEMKRVIALAGKGGNPCPEVMQWLDEKDKALERQIDSLRALRQRMQRFRHLCSTNDVLACMREEELCCLIEDLPSPQSAKGENDEKTLPACACIVVHTRG
jgi:MerR family transcriptional regulator, Zn(II)-responsive regulator of zntA